LSIIPKVLPLGFDTWAHHFITAYASGRVNALGVPCRYMYTYVFPELAKINFVGSEQLPVANKCELECRRIDDLRRV
jgi:hypothetical protein